MCLPALFVSGSPLQSARTEVSREQRQLSRRNITNSGELMRFKGRNILQLHSSAIILKPSIAICDRAVKPRGSTYSTIGELGPIIPSGRLEGRSTGRVDKCF